MDAIVESAPALNPAACCSRWTDMWNRLVPAAEVITAECRVYFGRKPQATRPTATTGPHELQSVIDTIREHLPGIYYRVQSRPRYQADSNTSGIITLLWNVAVPGQRAKSGIDLLRHEGAGITEVWSITGDFELPFMG